jgi:Protein of unknown function (DUF3309)
MTDRDIIEREPRNPYRFFGTQASLVTDHIIEVNRMRLVLLVVLIVLLLGALPTWPYSAGWGYYPSGGLGLVLLVVLVLALSGRL